MPPREDRRAAKRALSVDDLRRVLAHYRERDPWLYALLALMAHTGLRFAHASVIRWRDVDELAGVIRVSRTRTDGEAGPLARTKRAPAAIALTDELRALLAEQRARLRAARNIHVRACAEDPNAYCFPRGDYGRGCPRCGDRTRPILSSTWSHRWKRAMRALGIELAPSVGPHALRRTFVDAVRAAGVHAQVGRALTAHATDQQYDSYASVRPEETRDALERVAALIAGAPLAAATAARARSAGVRAGDCEGSSGRAPRAVESENQARQNDKAAKMASRANALKTRKA